MNIFLTSPISFPGLGIEGIDPPDGFCIPGTNFEIKFYGVIIAIGVLLAVTYCLRRAKQFGVTQDDILNLVLICLPSAIVARACTMSSSSGTSSSAPAFRGIASSTSAAAALPSMAASLARCSAC